MVAGFAFSFRVDHSAHHWDGDFSGSPYRAGYDRADILVDSNPTGMEDSTLEAKSYWWMDYSSGINCSRLFIAHYPDADAVASANDPHLNN